MSQCIRNISNKFTTVNSVLNTRKHVIHLDKELSQSSLSSLSPSASQRIKSSSPFLQEFLGARKITSAAATTKAKNGNGEAALSDDYEVWDSTTTTATATELKNERRKRNLNYSVSPIFPGQIMCASKRYDISPDDIIAWENRTDDSRSFVSFKEEIESLERTYNAKLSSCGATLFGTNDSISSSSNFEKRTILLADGKLNVEIKPEGIKDHKNLPDNDGEGKPSEEQLQIIHDNLSKTLPAFFTDSMDYTIYHQNIEFVNNIRGTVTRGLLNYIKQMSLLRTIGHLRFAYVKFEVLKITSHTEDSSIKVRWRIRGISGFKALAFFWKIKLWKMAETYDHQELWYDGFSSFYVGSDGLIHKHIADKMMPDQDDNPASKDSNAVAAKLTLFLGLLIPNGTTMCDMYNISSPANTSSRQLYSPSLIKESNGENKAYLVTDILSHEKFK